MRSFTLASVAPAISERSSPLEELDCRWIWALDLRRVKVQKGEVRDLKLSRLGWLTTGPSRSTFPPLFENSRDSLPTLLPDSYVPVLLVVDMT